MWVLIQYPKNFSLCVRSLCAAALTFAQTQTPIPHAHTHRIHRSPAHLFRFITARRHTRGAAERAAENVRESATQTVGPT